MVWNSWSDFFAMGGYGLYVWGSFGVTAAVVAAEIWSVIARRRVLSHRVHDAANAELGES
jgi:heme exporter protein D